MKNSAIILPEDIRPKGVSKRDIGVMNRNGKLYQVDVNGVEIPAHVTAASIATALGYTPANAADLLTLLDFKGPLDCSINPNYPVGLKADAYLVSVAGKIGGGSGKSVEIGDMVVCSADNAGGAEGAVGTSWFVLEHNLAGAVLVSDVTATVPLVTTDYEVPLPANGTYYGQKAIYHIKSTGGGNLTLHASLKVASLSTTAFPFALTAGKVYIVQLIWTPNGWAFATLTGGF